VVFAAEREMKSTELVSTKISNFTGVVLKGIHVHEDLMDLLLISIELDADNFQMGKTAKSPTRYNRRQPIRSWGNL
jgi:hypothetical protein